MAVIVGAIDPLEGSVIIGIGSALLALSTHLTKDRYRRIFLAAFIMIVFGVSFMFYFSSLGGFGRTASLSWWWGTLILPYPIGWLAIIILLITKAIKKHEN